MAMGTTEAEVARAMGVNAAKAAAALLLHAPPHEEDARQAHGPQALSLAAAADADGRKKHSGPRKRRPKKKPTTTAATATATPTATASATSTATPATASKTDCTPTSSPRSVALRPSATPFVPPVASPPPRFRLHYHSPPAPPPPFPPLPPFFAHSPLLSPSSSSRSPPLPPPLAPASPPSSSTMPLPWNTSSSSSSSLVDNDPCFLQEQERAYWTQFVIAAAEQERARRLRMLQRLQAEEEDEIRRRRAWATAAIEQEQARMQRELFLDNMKNTQWFQATISRFAADYEVVCPNSWFGCTFSCMLKDVETHLTGCVYRQVPDTLDQLSHDAASYSSEFDPVLNLASYDIVCPNAMLGCAAVCSRETLAEHLQSCPVSGMTREMEHHERELWQRNVIELTEQERARRIQEDEQASDTATTVTVPPSPSPRGFSLGHLQRLYEEQTAVMQVILHDEVLQFAHDAEKEALRVKDQVNAAIARLRHEVHALWGTQTEVHAYGSFTTRLHGDHSDVDLVVFNATTAGSESYKQAASDTAESLVLEEQVTQGGGKPSRTNHECVRELAARLTSLPPHCGYTAVTAITRASIPLVKVIVTVTDDQEGDDGDDEASDEGDHEQNNTKKALTIPFDITFDDPRSSVHNGIASAALLEAVMPRFYGLRELTVVLKHFLATRDLNDPYHGGLSSYGLVLMIMYVLRQQGALQPVRDEVYTTPSRDGNKINTVDEVSGAIRLSRYEEQRRKGLHVAEKVLRQAHDARVAMQAAQTNGTSQRRRRNVAAAWEILDPAGSATQPTRPDLGVFLDEGAEPKIADASNHIYVDDIEVEAKDNGADDDGCPRSCESQPFLLGKLLMDVLRFYGTEYRQYVDQISVLHPEEVITTGSMAGYKEEDTTSGVNAPMTSNLVATSPPLASSAPTSSSSSSSVSVAGATGSSVLSPPLSSISTASSPMSSSVVSPSVSIVATASHDTNMMILDPLQSDNNVGKTCYRINQVLREFSDFLSVLTALIVRGSVLGSTTIPMSRNKNAPGTSYSAAHIETGGHRILHSVFEMKTFAPGYVGAHSVGTQVHPRENSSSDDEMSGYGREDDDTSVGGS